MKFTFDSKKEGIAARNNKLKEEQANCHYVGATSQKLLGRIKERGFKQVFDCLDEDKVLHHYIHYWQILKFDLLIISYYQVVHFQHRQATSFFYLFLKFHGCTTI